ncbi:hypothetical protein B0H14DRAFT_2714522 [Mycena olivaceomarginata]|nr:hypothetical protein B0H14DRAFT_2714522 [Mycena olivaceomarginata]
MTSTPATLNVADTMVQRTPRFYPELEREMFETTAHMYRNTIPTLLRVARRVHYWIEPLLVPHQKSKEDYALLRITDSTTKPADFLLKAVRHMHLVTFAMHFFGHRPQNTWSEAELGIVLRACEGVESLFFLGSLDEPFPILPMLACMRPQRLYMTSEMSHPQLNLTAPFFRNISHLLLSDMESNPGDLIHGWPLLRNLSHLPALTHMALDQLTPPRVLESILSDCPNLQTLILYGENTATAPVPLDDQRVVIILSDNLMAQIVLISPDGRDIWARADLFISRKRSGDIEESCYQMEPVEEDTRAQPVADAVENTGLPSVPDPIPDPVENTVLSLTVSPRLETRLEQRIFKEVALLYPEMIPALLRVAHPRLLALLRATESKPESFLAGALRVELNAFPLSNGSSNHFPWHTQIFNSDNGWSDAELSSVLHRCTGRTCDRHTLALAADVVADHGQPCSGLPFLQNVTHLYFFDTEVNLFDAESKVFANWSHWSQISQLPALTHLALSCQTPKHRFIGHIALVILADVFVDGKYIAQHLPVFDPRLVVVNINWELERGSKHFWDCSEVVLRQKRSGEIKESCYYLELSIHR